MTDKMDLIRFLEHKRTSGENLGYALTDGYDVVFFNLDDEGTNIYVSDIHSVLGELMEHYGFEDHSP